MTYNTTARILHWLIAALVIPMIAAGLVMTQEIDRSIQDPLFIFHKNAGALLVLLVAFRIAWRLTHPAPPLPQSMPPALRIAAHATHIGLYVLLVVMVVSGYVRVVAGGFPIEILDGLGIPPLLPENEGVAETAKGIHAGAKNALIVLIVLHVAAAVWHGAILKDGVFSRMWPPYRPRHASDAG